MARSTRTSATRPATISAYHRGYAKNPGGGLDAEPVAGEPIGLHDILTSRLWRGLQSFLSYDFQTTMFQPVGGMGRIGEAFARQLPDRIRYGTKVTTIRQNETGVSVTYEDLAAGGVAQEVSADWCVCALPLTILSQLSINVSPPMKAAIDAVPYASAVKFGLQFSRRFWEEDEHIFGGSAHRPADPADFLPRHEFQRWRQGRAARRLHLRRTAVSLPVHGDGAGRES